MSDHIERTIELAAPVDRVWRALTDHREFGAWFKAAIDGPFVPGERSTGRVTYPGYEHLPWEARIVTMDPPSHFAWEWPPFYGNDFAGDTSADPWTRVDFRLEPTSAGTRLTVRETGFNRLPPERGPTAFRMNDGGWTEQMGFIRAHVEG